MSIRDRKGSDRKTCAGVNDQHISCHFSNVGSRTTYDGGFIYDLPVILLNRIPGEGHQLIGSSRERESALDSRTWAAVESHEDLGREKYG